MHALADMIGRLADAPRDAGAVVCIGLRLAGFTPDAWERTYAFLAAPANVTWVSQAERERAARFLRREDGVRHLLGRALLRRVLGRGGVHALPADWPVNAWGKPESWMGAHFSISHAGSDVWLAFSRTGGVGIDVEAAIPAAEDLTPWLHPEEAADIACLDDAACRQRLWVRKEAIVKAAGMGLSLPLSGFRVALDARARDWLLQAPDGFPPPWMTYDIPVPGDLAAAVAVMSGETAMAWRLGCLRWEA
jgi:4'-phosphopantetheinyl transferase